MNAQTILLRPHHALCLHFFRGRGYSAAFVENMTAVCAALRENPPVCLTASADAICAACPNNLGGVCRDAEKVACFDTAVLARCGLREGSTLPFRELSERAAENILRPGLRREICGSCQWDVLCREETP